MIFTSSNQALVSKLNVVLADVFRSPNPPLGHTKPLSDTPISALKVGDTIHVFVGAYTYLYRVI